ncbi:MAG: hypothetical protein VX768_19165 [Planctomycetota bacterium]|nr:hypothetical protein [Planctomycetota bacterium]
MSQAVDKRIPQVVSSKLTGLRLKIGSWLLVEALSRLLPTILGLVVFIFLVDYFLEMDVVQRVIISVLAGICLLLVAYFKLVKPFLGTLTDDALCLEVEKQNAELRDSLISAVQFARDVDVQRQGVSPAMVEATIEKGTLKAEQLDFGKALNVKRFFFNIGVTALALLLSGAFLYGMLNDPTLRVFMGRLLFYDGSEYARNTYLVFHDPEGRIVDGQLTIYRGQDCTLLVRVREDSLIKDVDVRMFYRDKSSGSWISDDMTRTKNRDSNEFKIVYKSVAVEFEVQARGGDGRSERLRVKLDEPPQFNNLSAEIIYPDYTVEVRPGDLVRVFDREKVYRYLGPRPDSDDSWEDQGDVTDNGQKLVEWGLLDEQQLASVQAELVNAPNQTFTQLARKLDMFSERDFDRKLQETLNIKTVYSEFDRNTLRDPSDFLDSFGGKLAILDGCSVRLTAMANCELSVAELVHAEGVQVFEPTESDFGYSLLIPATAVRNGRYNIRLRDATLREPPRAAGFEIEIKADASPEVRASTKGISGLIINRAKIPFTISVEDDFGATRLFLRYSWQDDTGEKKNSGTRELDEYEPVPSRDQDKPPEALKVSEILPARLAEFTQQFFDLDELLKEEKIPEGAGLKITIVAEDNDDVPAPNTGVSKEFLLRVVSEEEFRADLLRREKEARQEFDQIYKRQISTQTDTEALAADSKSENETSDEFYSELKKDLSEYYRSQRLIGENVESVIGRMEDLLTEGMNNRLDETTGEFESRYQDRIIGPMQSITDELMFELMAELSSARREIEDDVQRVVHLNRASELQKEVLAAMEAILKEMEKNEGIQEIINRVFEAKKLEERLKLKTKEEIENRIKNAGSGQPDGDGKGNDSKKGE